MIDKSEASDLKGLELRTTRGERVGRVGAVYVDDESGLPEWVTVDTGLFGAGQSFVPLTRAKLVADRLVVPYPWKQIRDAPRVADGEHLGEQDERDLYEHYGIPCLADGARGDDVSRG